MFRDPAHIVFDYSLDNHFLDRFWNNDDYYICLERDEKYEHNNIQYVCMSEFMQLLSNVGSVDDVSLHVSRGLSIDWGIVNYIRRLYVSCEGFDINIDKFDVVYDVDNDYRLYHQKLRLPRNVHMDIAVVIPCRNYGCYLADAIHSCLAQTLTPKEIVVVNDGSVDDTVAVASRFAPYGVRLINIQAHHAWRARQTGYQNTTSPILCFLDADDMIPPDYLQDAVNIFASDWKTGVVHPDMQHFGDCDELHTFPDVVSALRIRRDNVITASSVVRREALQISQAFADRNAPVTQTHADWWLFRCVLEHGWISRKNKSHLHYRRHSRSMLTTAMMTDKSWFERYVMERQTITLAIPLSGRHWAWPHLSNYLERQMWPHSQIQLILGDTSQDPDFAGVVRDWIRHCDYQDVRYVAFPAAEPGLADAERIGRPECNWHINRVMCYIWRKLLVHINQPFVWCMEDDIIPPDDVLERLLTHFTPAVDMVIAPYQNRFVNDEYIGYRAGKIMTKPAEPALEIIDSSGFGCSVFRGELLIDHCWALNKTWYDHWFAQSRDLKVICDWSCEAEHLDAPRDISSDENQSI